MAIRRQLLKFIKNKQKISFFYFINVYRKHLINLLGSFFFKKKRRILRNSHKDEWLLNDYVRFHETNLKFPNNEERILAIVERDLRNDVKEISDKSVIDYRNISRYLKKMEKKGLIKTEPDIKYKHMKSGRLKQYHTKRVRITKKGKELYIKLYRW